ncbi:hypothetical protein E4U22_001403 [Claviceps purpurea]|nr:hypothetical protein E4U22_001403 [Claviceps purpurea]
MATQQVVDQKQVSGRAEQPEQPQEPEETTGQPAKPANPKAGKRIDGMGSAETGFEADEG